MQALALVPQKRKTTFNIPYCCLTECIRESPGRGEWRHGVLMQHDFLSQQESREEAERQRRIWGFDSEKA